MFTIITTLLNRSNYYQNKATKQKGPITKMIGPFCLVNQYLNRQPGIPNYLPNINWVITGYLQQKIHLTEKLLSAHQ